MGYQDEVHRTIDGCLVSVLVFTGTVLVIGAIVWFVWYK